jgi:hypothetical protein
VTAIADETVWLPVADAAALIDTPPRNVHMWIHRYGLRVQPGPSNRKLVAVADVIATEAATRPERLRRLGAGQPP